MSVIEFVKLAGGKSIVLDINAKRLEFCRNVMGVDHTILGTDDLIPRLRDVTEGNLPDVVIDATGNAQSMSQAFGFVAPTGRLVYVGITTQEVMFKHPVFHRPEGTLYCSRNALPGDFTRIIDLIATGRLSTAPWITHRTPFGSIIENFPAYTRPETGVIKAVVEVN